MISYQNNGEREEVKAILDSFYYDIEVNRSTGKIGINSLPRPGLKKGTAYLEKVRSKISSLTSSHASNGGVH